MEITLVQKEHRLAATMVIAVAMALAILDDDSIKHPAIEAVFTVDEENWNVGRSST